MLDTHLKKCYNISVKGKGLKRVKGKMIMAQTVWTPNEKQAKFMDLLKSHADGLTLAQASKMLGEEIKSGSINTLLPNGKNLVRTEDSVIQCNLVAIDTGEVVGTAKKSVKKYFLVG